MDSPAVRCPQCHSRLCDRLPSGHVAGVFKCRGCKLELLLEFTPFSEMQLILCPPELTVDLAPFILKRTLDGRGLMLWSDYLARVLK
jgi:hypothetical protein